MDDHVVEKVAALRDDRIRNVTGEVVCQEEGAVVRIHSYLILLLL